MDVDPSCSGINQTHPDSSEPSVSKVEYTYRGLSITFQSFYPDRVIPLRVWHIPASFLPISPASDIVEAFVKFPVLEVPRRHNTISTRGIDQVVEL